MDMSKVNSMEECIHRIQSMEKVCHEKFKNHVCMNLKHFYLEKCYNKFVKTATCSDVNTLGGNTLNLINKSPSPPSL